FQDIRELCLGLALGLDVIACSVPAGAIRWNSMNSRWEKFNGCTWDELVSKYLINVDTVDGLHASDFATADHDHASVFQPLDAELTALAGLVSAANTLPYFTGSGTADLTDLSAFARTLLDDLDAAAARATLGLGDAATKNVGTATGTVCAGDDSRLDTVDGYHASDFAMAGHDHASLYQPLDAELTALAGLASAADKAPYFTGAGAAALMTVTSMARMLLDDADPAAMRATLGISNNSGAIPVGASIAMAGETVPDGFLEENGQAVSRTTYAALFAYLGTAHGAGDGSTTFNVPDSRGEFHRGWDHGRGVDPDRASRTAAATGGATGDHVGAVQGEAFKSHYHHMDTTSNAGGGSYSKPTYNPNSDCPLNGTDTTSTGGNETRPRNRTRMYCIKY
ncbi:MAG: phage tail protein, partial [Humidesulfovibrio sp.]|nr:phage tail protein [Humidesulfovibrio sp.]